MRKLVALTVCLVAVTFVVADFTGTITSVTCKDGKCTINYTKKAKKKGDDPTKHTVVVSEKTPVFEGKAAGKGKVDKGDEIKGGIASVKIGDKGQPARFITKDKESVDDITEILIIQPKKAAAGQ
jgi:hypothetical protein